MGHTLKSFQGKNYYGFQDVPYGAPPEGEGRFAVSTLNTSYIYLSLYSNVIAKTFTTFPEI